MARSTSASRRYAEAAFQIALRDGSVDAWRRELDHAAGILSDDRVLRGLTNPGVPLESRETLVTETIGASVGRPVLSLILLLLRRGRIELLPRIAAEFTRLDHRRLGITPATAISAVPLETGDASALVSRLEQLTGGRVELELQVDPSILGGLVVRVGDRLMDGSVRGRLERLRSRLVSGAL